MLAIRLGFLLLLAACVAPSRVVAASNSAPSGLAVAIVGAEVRLAWLAPDPGSGNTQVRLLRRLNAPPTGPDDAAAAVLYAGGATQFGHPTADLMPDVAGSPHVYYYAVYGCDAPGTTCETAGSHASLAPTLVQCLRGGGYTIYWRHTDADVCTDKTNLGPAATTTVPNWWRSCDANCATATARQLNATGVQRATYIGQVFQTLGIPIGRAISSEFCRCIQTLEWMNFGPMIETDQGITYFVYDEANRCSHSFNRVSQVPAPGTNTAIVGHLVLSTCPPLDGLEWSECAIFKPNGGGGTTLITRMVWSAWGGLTTGVTPLEMLDRTTTLERPQEIAGGLRIRYRIATGASTPTRLEVFDVRGRRMWSVRAEAQGPGEYERVWDRRDRNGREVVRGIYFVRLTAGSSVQSRKTLLLGR